MYKQERLIIFNPHNRDEFLNSLIHAPADYTHMTWLVVEVDEYFTLVLDIWVHVGVDRPRMTAKNIPVPKFIHKTYKFMLGFLPNQ